MLETPEYDPQWETDRKEIPFEEQMRWYQSAGVEITFANARLSLEDIVRICTVREKGEYMCDFMADEKNRIIRIDVTPVSGRGNNGARNRGQADSNGSSV